MHGRLFLVSDGSEWFCNRIVDIKARGNPEMSFDPTLLILVFTQSSFTGTGKAQLGGWLCLSLPRTTKVDNHECKQKHDLIPSILPSHSTPSLNSNPLPSFYWHWLGPRWRLCLQLRILISYWRLLLKTLSPSLSLPLSLSLSLSLSHCFLSSDH